MQLKLISIEVMSVHPLEANSKPMLPEPAKRSKSLISLKLMLLLKMLNRLSLAKFVVGLIGNPFGAIINLPLYFPLIIRTGVGVKVYNIRVPRVN